MSKSNEYGYIPDSPTQARGSNSGVFEVNDIVDLLADEKWTLDEQPALTLIEYQSVSSVTEVNFSSIDESTYDYHLLTWTDIDTGIRDNANYWRLRVKVGGTNQTSGYINFGMAQSWGSNSANSYKELYQYRNTDNYGHLASTNRGWGDNVSSVDSSLNGYAVISKAGDSNFTTSIQTQAIGQSYASGSTPYIATIHYKNANTVDGFRIYMNGYSFSGKLGLYGYN